MSGIEFRNNGVKDSLTGAPTTLIFIELLEREIAQRSRLQDPLSLVLISIPRTKDAYKVFLLNQAIRSVLRREDFYCRASDDGFWIAMRTDEAGAKLASHRFEKSFQDTLLRDRAEYRADVKNSYKVENVRIQSLEYRPGTKPHDWLKVVDELYFSL